MQPSQPGWGPKVPDPRRLADRLLVSDPGLQRFRMAGRATIAVATTVLVGFLLIGQQSPTAPLFGAVVALMGSMMANDPEPKQRKITTLLLFVPAAVSATLGALLSSITWLSDAGLIAIIFFAFYVRRFGPRYLAIGMMTLIPFFFSSILHFGFGQLPWLFAAAAIGVLSAYLFRFVLLPDRPERILRRSVSAFHLQLGMIVDSAIEVVEDGAGGGSARKKLRKEMQRLDACATTAESQISAPNFDGPEEECERLRLYLFDAQMSAHTLSEMARSLVSPGRTPPFTVRASLLRALHALREPLSRGESPDGYSPASEALADLASSRESASDEGISAWRPPVLRAETAIRLLLEGPTREREMPPTTREEASEESEEDEMEGRAAGILIGRLEPTTIQGFQAALAAALAEVAGTLLFPSRSYWAVITAFVVFARARSIGETFARGLQRTAGTLLGVIAGFFLASAISGDIYVDLALIFFCIFMAFYLFAVSYGFMVFWITTMLAVMYSLLGQLSGQILGIRLVDTLVGAAIGVLVSVLVLPARTSDKIKSGTAEYLDLFEDYTRGCVDRLVGETPPVRPLDAVRELDGKLQEVNQTIETLKRGVTIFGRSAAELDRLATSLAALDHYAWHLALLPGLEDEPEPVRNLLCQIAGRIAENLDILCEALSEGPGDRNPRSLDDLMERLETTADTEIARIISVEQSPVIHPSILANQDHAILARALFYLRRVNRTVLDLAESYSLKPA